MLAGCRDNVVDRNSLNIASKGAELPNRLSLQLHGASLLSSTTEESETVMHALSFELNHLMYALTSSRTRVDRRQFT